MNGLKRLVLIGVAVAAVQAAFAQATFTLVSATYTLGNTGPYNFTFIPNSVTMQVDILPGTPAFKVGDSTPYGSGTGQIIYNVTSATPITGIDLVLQGNVIDWGEINFTETAETSTGGILGVINGVIRGDAYAGGVDGAFTRTVRLNFDHAVTSFKVKKTFDMDIAAQSPPSLSVATIGIIEQNLVPVPEPATMVGLALGASALLARRRKKS